VSTSIFNYFHFSFSATLRLRMYVLYGNRKYPSTIISPVTSCYTQRFSASDSLVLITVCEAKNKGCIGAPTAV